ncbi:DUF3416 domain-containing protein [Salinactinospora qingdaonensis]|uniref:Alpha-1,4-glucan:maltose-1-phosphate maltosyltransferase n=2 Tax=Salinactinospora qingdaonensis TaxID=702744 RepID=A0ABP7G0I3_9ACTN
MIDDISPLVSGGRYPAKAVVGEQVPVHATIWREGHEALAAEVELADRSRAPRSAVPMELADVGTDRWRAVVTPDEPGMWEFRIRAWSDPWTSWRTSVTAKLAVSVDAPALANDLESGALLIDRQADRSSSRDDRDLLRRAAAALRDTNLPLSERVKPALGAEVARVVAAAPPRELVVSSNPHRIWVDRPRALFGSWYEFFPRSTGGRDEHGRAVHGTFATAERELGRIADMGFDVVYLPPIHPIGTVNRKGRNNALTAEPNDVGSPWAIGSSEGGHDAVHPELGDITDFDAFVTEVRRLDMEVALDLALQCAPDHPWVRHHPEWFTTRPDGSIAFAENPPKTYEDIYPLNFDNDPEGLYAEILRVVTFWIEHGVRIFRVDNPHTKPPDFWHRLIWQVKETYPEVLFLAEAFTRPAILNGLAKLGFTQSYTYFTWRTTKRELTEYLTELVDSADWLRPNLFVNTPDILHRVLQEGGPHMFAVRAALAATLSPTWGVYSGFELFERQPLRPGSEEYLDSEKYELRPRDYSGALRRGESLQPWITELNRLRRAHPALRNLRTLRFHDVTDEALIAYSKTDPGTGDHVLCVVDLAPISPREAEVRLDTAALGLDDGAQVTALDEIYGGVVELSATSTVTIDPKRSVARVFAWRSH